MDEKQIYVMGRSLGSGPSTHIAAKFDPGCLLLVSPYTSIQSVANTQVGFLSVLVAQQYDNLSKIEKVICPTFILHGEKDGLIPIEQASALSKKCSGPCTFVPRPEMTHNSFYLDEDLIKPLYRFLNSYDFEAGHY